MKPKIGVRWDDEAQNQRFIEAKDLGLLQYIEVNYPVAARETPTHIGLPLYAHSAYNGLCSAFGLNMPLVNLIKSEAEKYESPWIGEHLSWISPSSSGGLGYVFNSVYNDEFIELTVNNIEKLKSIYKRPIALELGPQYSVKNSDMTEIDFHCLIASKTNCPIILDITHTIISAKNLNRPLHKAIDAYLNTNVIELHVAGMKQSRDLYWHDCHDNNPDDETIEVMSHFIKNSESVKGVTFEHTPQAPKHDFFNTLIKINKELQ